MAHEQISPAQEEARQKRQREELEKRIADRVTRWDKPQRDDYDFRTWTNQASQNCLQAGMVYEYARESHRLRCLLALMNPKRQREKWEIVRPALFNYQVETSEDGQRWNPVRMFNNVIAAQACAKNWLKKLQARVSTVQRTVDIDTYPKEKNWLRCSFEGLNEHDAERMLGGFLPCLLELADELADNISFAKLFQTKRKELDKAFGGLDDLARVGREFRHFWPVSDAVEVATRSGADLATVRETIKRFKGRFIYGEACSEVIALRIHWRFTNVQIGKAMERFAREYRPRKKACKEPKQKGQRPKERILAALKALSVMRIWKVHKRDPWKRLELVANTCAYAGCVNELAEYKERCSQGRGDEPMSNAPKAEMSKARKDALSCLQSHFSGEKASNF
jgi:hypothetical protein